MCVFLGDNYMRFLIALVHLVYSIALCRMSVMRLVNSMPTINPYTSLIPPYRPSLLHHPTDPSPKRLRNTIRHHQLITRLEAPPQIPHPLIQSRSKHLINITKHALMILQPQPLPQKLHHRVEM